MHPELLGKNAEIVCVEEKWIGSMDENNPPNHRDPNPSVGQDSSCSRPYRQFYPHTHEQRHKVRSKEYIIAMDRRTFLKGAAALPIAPSPRKPLSVTLTPQR